MTLEDSEALATEAALAAGAVLRRRFAGRHELSIERKAHRDYVTEVDREAEAAVVSILRSRSPEDAIVAEEGSPFARGTGRRWIVDPLDGTTNFIHGVPTFAVSVALEDTRGLAVGVVHDPCRNETFHARRGGGACLDGRPIRCTSLTALDPALLATGFPFRDLSRLDAYLSAFESFVRATSGLRRAGSASLDLAYTACGRYDGFFEIGLSAWDLAAGALLVTEAGGVVTTVEGGSAFLLEGTIVAAGAGLHPLMLDVTKRTLGSG